jgi:hypothetical protein
MSCKQLAGWLFLSGESWVIVRPNSCTHCQPTEEKSYNTYDPGGAFLGDSSDQGYKLRCKIYLNLVPFHDLRNSFLLITITASDKQQNSRLTSWMFSSNTIAAGCDSLSIWQESLIALSLLLHHSCDWKCCTPTDLCFPFFLFISSYVANAFSYQNIINFSNPTLNNLNKSDSDSNKGGGLGVSLGALAFAAPTIICPRISH